MNIMCHIGLGCYVSSQHTIAIIQPGSITAKRRLNAAKKMNKYSDCSHGKGIKAYILLDDNSVIASHLSPSTLAKRYVTPFSSDSDANNPNISEPPMIRDTSEDVSDEELPFSEIIDGFDDDEDTFDEYDDEVPDE